MKKTAKQLDIAVARALQKCSHRWNTLRDALHFQRPAKMNDNRSTAERSERMSRVKGRDTGPEWAVRRLVHGLGYRYRLHRKDLPGCPDLVFPARRKVIFVHGCFWHRHPDPACKLARLPKSRLEFWLPKLNGNRARDLHNQARLIDSGWQIMVVWECEIGTPDLKEKIEGFLNGGNANG